MNILEVNGPRNLITGDYPVINTYGLGKDLNEPVEGLEFYHPVSPKLAIIFSDKVDKNEVIKIDEDQVIKFNKVVMSESLEQVYAQKKEDFVGLF
ncbi:DUF4238 domain-containing protein [Candidatus Uabimicrobium amorphum]|uniref:DUF4238 domain-containing protein n=1 Tax=Uabimicrobium amorphum TaxID=2596890 RepID=UPI0036F2A205